MTQIQLEAQITIVVIVQIHTKYLELKTDHRTLLVLLKVPIKWTLKLKD